MSLALVSTRGSGVLPVVANRTASGAGGMRLARVSTRGGQSPPIPATASYRKQRA